MKASVNGISVNYQVDGIEDGPWLVLSNPLATRLALWDAQVARLGQFFRILRYDQRGHGATDAPSGRYDFGTLADDVIALLDALSIRRAHFVGLSMGAATAVAICKREPARLDRVALCDSSGASSPVTHRQWEERIALVLNGGMAAVAESLVQRWLAPSALAGNAPHVDVVRQMILNTPVNGFVGCAAAIGNHDFRSTIHTMPRPTLFLVGDKDVTAASVMRSMHEALPNSRYVEIADAGHISNVDQPAAFTRAIEEFLLAR
jgi:3-oxoadipate enol-lactonase